MAYNTEDIKAKAESEWSLGENEWNLENKETTVQDGKVISNKTNIEQRAIKRRIENNEIHFKKAKALDDLCGRPQKNEQWRIITEKQFNAYSLILSVLQSEEIEELWIAIYRINKPTVDSIIELIQSGKIKTGGFIISSFFNQTKKPEQWAKKLKSFCETNKDFGHCYINNHAKVILIKTKSDFLVFEGSGNMSDNGRIEKYLYENHENVFNFHRNWISNLCINYGL